MSQIDVPIQIWPHYEGLDIPQYKTEGSSGMDLLAACDTDVLLQPGRRVLIPTGISIALPKSAEAQIRPRSGLALRNGITLLNTPGTIDADYRGEIKVILINLGDEDFLIKRGMRIAQMVFGPVLKARLLTADTLDTTARGSGGFGHTGIH